jgi:hypothetical protein
MNGSNKAKMLQISFSMQYRDIKDDRFFDEMKSESMFPLSKLLDATFNTNLIDY